MRCRNTHTVNHRLFFCSICLWAIKYFGWSCAMITEPWTINPSTLALSLSLSLPVWYESAVCSPPGQRQTHFTTVALAAQFTPNNSLARSRYEIPFHVHDNQLLQIYIKQSNNNTPGLLQHMCFVSKRSWEANREFDLAEKIGRRNNKWVCCRVLKGLSEVRRSFIHLLTALILNFKHTDRRVLFNFLFSI